MACNAAPADPNAEAVAPAGLRPRARLLLVAVPLSASVVAAWQTHRLVAAHQQSRFAYEMRRIESAVHQRMNAYVQALGGGAGLFRVSPPSREQWLHYVEQLQLAERYPGFKSLSFAAAVTPQELPAFVERVRAEPLPPELHNPDLIRQFTPRSPVAGAGAGSGAASDAPPLHAPIIYVAPRIPDSRIELAGRTWTLRYSAGTDFIPFTDRLAP